MSKALTKEKLDDLSEHANELLKVPSCTGCYGCEGGGQYCMGELRRARVVSLRETILALIVERPVREAARDEADRIACKVFSEQGADRRELAELRVKAEKLAVYERWHAAEFAVQEHFNKRGEMSDAEGCLTRAQFDQVSDELDVLIREQLAARAALATWGTT